ncbi:MAG TPA: ribokinase [Thermoanaerobaculia bacterium]|nr:ribokinase [Thermoanaerobaculia bacterium]
MTESLPAELPACVLVAGSCIVDFCVKVPRLPRPGETVLASGFTRSLGGKGANQATALRRLGGEVAILTCLGEDDPGESFMRLFREEGIRADLVWRDRSAPTGMAFPMVLPGGANAIVAAPSSSLLLPLAAVAAAGATIRRARALLLQLEIPLPAAAAAMDLARRAGVPVFLNPAPAVEGSARLLGGADVLIPNQIEAEALSGLSISTAEDALRAAARLRAMGPETVVVTLGEEGAVVSAPGIERLIPAYPVAAVDTTGAGDAFCAGLVDAFCRGAGWPDAVDFACACGALACRGEGAIPWLPTRAQAAELARSRAGGASGPAAAP